MKRLTITLPDDLYAMARSKAIASNTSISRAIGDLLRERSGARPGAPPPMANGDDVDSYFDPVLGIRVSRCDGPLTDEDVQRALDEEDLRHLESMGPGSKGTDARADR